jgi:GMP synthase-like glutamine amidotransferase
MSVALGGEVTRRGDIKGIAAGSLSVSLTELGRKQPLMQGLSKLDSDCAFHFGNGGEVSSVPLGAQVLATSKDSDMIALDYGNNWVSTQVHLEASHTAFQHWVDSGVIKPPSEEEKYRPLAKGRNLISNFLRLQRPFNGGVAA